MGPQFLVFWVCLMPHVAHAWCEANNHDAETLIVEPWNAVSSLAFCATAIYGLVYAPTMAWAYRTVLYLCFWTGAGSALHHGLWSEQWTHAYDIVPMTLLSGSTFAYCAATLTADVSPLARTVAGFASTLVTCMMLIAYAQSDSLWRTLFVVSIGGIAVVQGLVMVRWLRGGWAYTSKRYVLQRFLWCLCLLVVGSLTWVFDDLGMVDGSCVFSLHAVFHVCAALALHLTVSLSAHLRHPLSRCRPAFPAVPWLLFTFEQRGAVYGSE